MSREQSNKEMIIELKSGNKTKGRTMDDKTTNYVNAVITSLTGQRNQALDLNVKLQAENSVLKAQIVELSKDKEDKEEDKEEEEVE